MPSYRGYPDSYTSLARVREQLTLASQNTSEDEVIQRFIYTASRAIDRYTNRRFTPTRRTHYYDLPDDLQCLKTKDRDLLEVHGLSDMNGASQVGSEIYWLECGDTYNLSPYDRIVLDRFSGSTFNYSGTPQRAIHVDGTWGFHTDFDNAWIDTGASISASVSTTETVISLGGASEGLDVWGMAPRIETNQLLKIGSEYVQVLAGSGASGIIVRRGANGTTAASHAASVTVERWDVEPDIEFAARELAQFQFLLARSPMTGEIATPILSGFSVQVPNTWPRQTKERLEHYKRSRVYSF